MAHRKHDGMHPHEAVTAVFHGQVRHLIGGNESSVEKRIEKKAIGNKR